jgi:hypothetical protein
MSLDVARAPTAGVSLGPNAAAHHRGGSPREPRVSATFHGSINGFNFHERFIPMLLHASCRCLPCIDLGVVRARVSIQRGLQPSVLRDRWRAPTKSGRRPRRDGERPASRSVDRCRRSALIPTSARPRQRKAPSPPRCRLHADMNRCCIELEQFGANHSESKRLSVPDVQALRSDGEARHQRG